MNRTGIYMIFNFETEDFYIGSARVNFNKRYKQHFVDLRGGRHINNILQRSFNKHGGENFYFIIIEFVDGEDNILNKEQFYIDELNPRYNIAKNVRQPKLGIKMSEEHKERLRQINLGKPAWNKGIPFCEETRRKMSISKKGKSTINKGKFGTSNKKVIRDDGIIFDNIYEAAKQLGVKQNTIVKSINDKTIIRKVKGYRFLYLEESEQGFRDKKVKEDIHIHINQDKFIVRYKDVNGNVIYKGRFDTKEEAIIMRNELFKTNPPRGKK